MPDTQRRTLLIPYELQEFFVKRILVRLQHTDPVLTLTNMFFGFAVFQAPFEVLLKVIDGTRVIPGQGTSYATAITNAAVMRFQRDRSLTSRHHVRGKAQGFRTNRENSREPQLSLDSDRLPALPQKLPLPL